MGEEKTNEERRLEEGGDLSIQILLSFVNSPL
jgi:hypothetical protein